MQLHAWMELNEMELLLQALHSVSKGFHCAPTSLRYQMCQLL
jgi:hypothetical protein